MTLVRSPYTPAGPMGTAADVITLVSVTTLVVLTVALVLSRRIPGFGPLSKIALVVEILFREAIHWLFYALVAATVVFVTSPIEGGALKPLTTLWMDVVSSMVAWRRGGALAFANCDLLTYAEDPRRGAGAIPDAFTLCVHVSQAIATISTAVICVAGFQHDPVKAVLFAAAYVVIRAVDLIKGYRAFPSPVIQAITGLAHGISRGRGTEGTAETDDRIEEEDDYGNPMATVKTAEATRCDHPFVDTVR